MVAHNLKASFFKRLIRLFWMIQMALSRNRLYERPVELTLNNVLAPVFLKVGMYRSQMIRRNPRRNMMRHMDIDIVTQKLNPARIATVNRTG